MEKDRPSASDPDVEQDVAPDDIIDIGTEPVGESADPVYNLGTDTVIGSERPSEDTVYMIGTDPVGKSVEPQSHTRTPNPEQD